MRHLTNDVTCTELAIFPAGTISLATLLGGTTMLIELGRVPKPTARPQHIVTHGHVMRMDIW